MNNLKAVSGRVIVSVDLQLKNSHKFSDGTTIRIERQFDNFNKRETEPVNGIVIDAENIPSGAEILIGHNALHDVNRIFDYKSLSGKDIASDIKYYSLPDSECFLWRMGDGEWNPIPPFETALRVYSEYSGKLVGVEPSLIKDVLFVVTGELKNNVVKNIKASDYCVVYQGANGKEERLIRFRPYGDDKTNREPEAICIMNKLTEMVIKDQLLIGIELKDAKYYSEYGAIKVL